MESVRSTGRWGYHQSSQLAERQYRVEWAESSANPEGKDRWAADLDIADNGEIRIPQDAAQPYFHGKGAHLMLNVYCDMPKGAGYYAGIGFFKKPNLYGFDRVTPQDTRGHWTYSRPVHLEKEGDKNFFFFMTLRNTSEDGRGQNVELTIWKITVARGREHYRLMVDKYLRSQVFEVNNLADDAVKILALRDLPIRQLVAAYQDWNA
ncbi:MAG: hypothetical protein KW802_00780 [Candidatus Doudnabacteria bacterium]|nr:hypothetical protein [Candidatus Doudnabacteria bacterium]